MENLTNTENTILGGTTAVVVGLILQPTLYWKNAAQQGKPFTLNPRVLYRGLGAALTAEIGQMGLQFFLTGWIKKTVLLASAGTAASAAMKQRGESLELTPAQEMTSALVGGAISALYTSPVELTMIQQQNFAGTFFSTAARLFRTNGFQGLYRGLTATAMRDGVYTLGLLGMVPVLQKRLERDFGFRESPAGFIASCVGGTICGAISCPFDAIKTCMQGDVEKKEYGSFRATWGVLAQKRRLFGGVGWRIVYIAGTLVIANEFRIQATPYLFPGKQASRGAAAGH